jgi:HPt (histidine-containing phosphotransfer) domain-containing protein
MNFFDIAHGQKGAGMLQAVLPNYRDAPSSEHRVVDLVRLARMTLGDRALEREVLQLFVRQSRMVLEQLASAEASRTRILAHTLKGSARSVGADRVAAAAELVECASSTGMAAALTELRSTVSEALSTIESLLGGE